jgi:hypothetical protein
MALIFQARVAGRKSPQNGAWWSVRSGVVKVPPQSTSSDDLTGIKKKDLFE